jgi:hypothetical protein
MTHAHTHTHTHVERERAFVCDRDRERESAREMHYCTHIHVEKMLDAHTHIHM